MPPPVVFLLCLLPSRTCTAQDNLPLHTAPLCYCTCAACLPGAPCCTHVTCTHRRLHCAYRSACTATALPFCCCAYSPPQRACVCSFHHFHATASVQFCSFVVSGALSTVHYAPLRYHYHLRSAPPACVARPPPASFCTTLRFFLTAPRCGFTPQFLFTARGTHRHTWVGFSAFAHTRWVLRVPAFSSAAGSACTTLRRLPSFLHTFWFLLYLHMPAAPPAAGWDYCSGLAGATPDFPATTTTRCVLRMLHTRCVHLLPACGCVPACYGAARIFGFFYHLPTFFWACLFHRLSHYLPVTACCLLRLCLLVAYLPYTYHRALRHLLCLHHCLPYAGTPPLVLRNLPAMRYRLVILLRHLCSLPTWFYALPACLSMPPPPACALLVVHCTTACSLHTGSWFCMETFYILLPTTTAHLHTCVLPLPPTPYA